jgi:hypothetical protein
MNLREIRRLPILLFAVVSSLVVLGVSLPNCTNVTNFHSGKQLDASRSWTWSALKRDDGSMLAQGAHLMTTLLSRLSSGTDDDCDNGHDDDDGDAIPEFPLREKANVAVENNNNNT